MAIINKKVNRLECFDRLFIMLNKISSDSGHSACSELVSFFIYCPLVMIGEILNLFERFQSSIKI